MSILHFRQFSYFLPIVYCRRRGLVWFRVVPLISTLIAFYRDEAYEKEKDGHTRAYAMGTQGQMHGSMAGTANDGNKRRKAVAF